MGISKQLSMLVTLTRFLTFFKSRKIFTFSHLNSINFNDNLKCNFMPEKVNKMISKAKTLNFCAWANWKWIHDDLILNRKKWLQQFNYKFLSTLVVLTLSFASFAFFSPAIRLPAFSSSFLITSFTSLSVTPLVCCSL